MSELKPRDWWDRAGFRYLTGVVCAAVAVSAIASLLLSTFGSKASAELIGFEIVTLAACSVGAVQAFRYARQGPAMLLACVAGAVGVGSLLAHVGSFGMLAGYRLDTALWVRFAAAGFLAASAACVVLSRDPARSVPSLVKGVVWGVILVCVLAAAWVMRGTILSAGGIVRVMVALLLGITGIGLIAACSHYLIRAFAFGVGPRFDEGAETGA